MLEFEKNCLLPGEKFTPFCAAVSLYSRVYERLGMGSLALRTLLKHHTTLKNDCPAMEDPSIYKAELENKKSLLLNHRMVCNS